MAALPEKFLTKLIAESAAMKGIVDAQHNVKETDPTMTACAKIAYTQICKYCRRPFHYGERNEYYENYVAPLLLRVLPVDLQQPVTVTMGLLELLPEQFQFHRNRLILFGDTKDDPGDPRYEDLEVIYTGGIALLESNNTLYTGMLMQTIANYHRRDIYGLSETSGEKGIARSAADSGELIESVRQLLDELMYNGIGYTTDGE